MKRELGALIEKLKEGHALGAQGRHEEARVPFEEARAGAEALGIRSGADWYLATCHDCLGDYARAMAYVR